MDIIYQQNGLSYHPTDRTYNEKNYGEGLALRDRGEWIKQIAIGRYLNSLNKESKYLDLSAHKKLNGLMSIGAGTGIVTGYGDPVPYVLPELRIGNKDYEANIRYAPKTEFSPEVWMLNLGYRLK